MIMPMIRRHPIPYLVPGSTKRVGNQSAVTQQWTRWGAILKSSSGSVFRRLPGLRACASHLASRRQAPPFYPNGSIEIMPHSCRMPVEPYTGRPSSCFAGQNRRPRFRRHLRVFRHVISGSRVFVFPRNTCRRSSYLFLNAPDQGSLPSPLQVV